VQVFLSVDATVAMIKMARNSIALMLNPAGIFSREFL
jgi:hypothetical protein